MMRGSQTPNSIAIPSLGQRPKDGLGPREWRVVVSKGRKEE